MRVLLLVLVLWILTRRLAYGTPTDPVGGTVITVAYAVANILDPIRWLRSMTGGSDPPGSNYWLRSTSTTAVAWVNRASEVLAALGYTPVNKAGDSMTGVLNLQVGAGLSLGGTPAAGQLVDLQATATVLQSHNDHLVVVDDTNAVVMLDVNKVGSAFTAFGQTVWTSGNDGATSQLDAGLLAGEPPSYYVPPGLVALWGSAAPPAGWVIANEFADRFPLGASATYPINTSGGNASAHTHDIAHGHAAALTSESTTSGGTVQGGGSSSADPQHHRHNFTAPATGPYGSGPGTPAPMPNYRTTYFIRKSA